jgi:hypothetical protein
MVDDLGLVGWLVEKGSNISLLHSILTGYEAHRYVEH